MDLNAHAAESPGDLARSARSEAVRRARPVLIGLGLFFVVTGLGEFAGREQVLERFRATVQKDIGPWEIFKRLDAAHKIVVFERAYRIVCWATLGVGLIYPALALLARRSPVSATVLGTSLTIAVTCFIAHLFVARGAGPTFVGAAIEILIVALILRRLFRATRAAVALAESGRAAETGPSVAPAALHEVASPPADPSPRVLDDDILFIPDEGMASWPGDDPGGLEFSGVGVPWGAVVCGALAIGLGAVGLEPG